MVRVDIFRTSTGSVAGFTASGHAGYARRGSDIVCAAVSALTQTAVIALPNHAGVNPDVAVDEESGLLTCQLPGDIGALEFDRAQLILETMVTGLTEIAREYQKYMSIREVKQR